MIHLVQTLRCKNDIYMIKPVISDVGPVYEIFLSLLRYLRSDIFLTIFFSPAEY